MEDESGKPEGTPYDWFRRAEALLAQKRPEDAVPLLRLLVAESPESTSAREDLARALFDCGRYQAAAEQFSILCELAPDDDYAHFGLGVSLWRLREFSRAVEHLAVADVMAPGNPAYRRAYEQVRATLESRRRGGFPTDGFIGDV